MPRFVRDSGTNQTKEWTKGRKPASMKLLVRSSVLPVGYTSPVVCCSGVLQWRVAVACCSSVLQLLCCSHCVAVVCTIPWTPNIGLTCLVVCCSGALQSVCCSPCIAVSALQSVCCSSMSQSVCCSQCVAEACCSRLLQSVRCSSVYHILWTPHTCLTCPIFVAVTCCSQCDATSV